MNAPNVPECPGFQNPDPGQKQQDSVLTQLTDAQLAALDMLVGGAKVTFVAQELKIDRRTLYRWRNEDPVFVAELQRRRSALFEFGLDRFRNLTWLALDRLESQIRNPYAPISMQAARAILSMARLGQEVGAQAREVSQNPLLMNHLSPQKPQQQAANPVQPEQTLADRMEPKDLKEPESP